MSRTAARVSLVFSCVGHTYIHMFTAFYFVIVLALEKQWGVPYHTLIELWTPGAMLVGLAALPAGWLGDRWSAGGMMVVFFVGMGAASIVCGFVDGTTAMMMGLTAIGLFASIYHPVGVAWLVRNSDTNRGKVLAVNGIFGSVGVAAAGAVAGALIDLSNWRVAFVLPGIVSVITGLGLWYCLYRGWVTDESAPRRPQAAQTRSDMMRVFMVLLCTMFFAAVIYQSNQVALPKVFSERLAAYVGHGTFGVGALVAVVYGAAGVMQLVGGHLADRYSLKIVYAGFFLAEIPLLFAAGQISGLPLIPIALLMVVSGVGLLPAENMLLARYTPEKHHGLAFGVKFVLAFGAAPAGLLLVSFVREQTGGFYWLYAVLSACAALCLFAALMLPATRAAEKTGAAPTPAE